MLSLAIALSPLCLSGFTLLVDTAHADEADPRLWLEEVEGQKALDWVRAGNAQTLEAFAKGPRFTSTRDRLRASLDSDARIPYVEERGDYLYNFWVDGAHPQGLWRRTTWAEYRKAEPQWELILDLDALSEKEGQRWVWHGSNCLAPDWSRCMVELSPGGSDTGVLREFDVSAKTFVADGFVLPPSKGEADWLDRDHLLLATDFGEGSLTDSGYARTVRIWTRGTAYTAAAPLFEGKRQDVSVGGWHDDTPGFERDFVYRALTFYTGLLYERVKGKLVQVEKPDDCEASVYGDHIYFRPRTDWAVGGVTHKGGSLLVAPYKAWMKGERRVEALFTPTDSTSLQGWTATRGQVALEILEDVRSRVELVTPPQGRKNRKRGWTHAPLQGIPKLGTVSVSAVDADASDALWIVATDYLTPSTLSLQEPGAAPEVLKRGPSFFKTDGLTVEQHFATSKDGTRVPYFQVGPTAVPTGGLPTLLYGYGGFEVSLTPGYQSGFGIGWLEQGGVYVVANIRGGGEYGPRWHQAALREKRHAAYEDFAAVGEDLVKRGVTRKEKLGVMGGSNGGLLMGNMYTTYPDHWGAVVCQVPLLDMKRYSGLLAGASWMGEYGDPSVPEDWAFLQRYSPYHNMDAAKAYPPILFTTSTRDDRVHPGHARKMASLIDSLDKPMFYYENIEGGHGGAANNEQRAFMWALSFEFLWQTLAPPQVPPPQVAPPQVPPPQVTPRSSPTAP